MQQKLKSLTFSARYLGYQDVMESKLIPGQCVEVVHSCVKELTAALSDRPNNADQVNYQIVWHSMLWNLAKNEFHKKDFYPPPSSCEVHCKISFMEHLSMIWFATYKVVGFLSVISKAILEFLRFFNLL